MDGVGAVDGVGGRELAAAAPGETGVVSAVPSDVAGGGLLTPAVCATTLSLPFFFCVFLFLVHRDVHVVRFDGYAEAWMGDRGGGGG